MQPLYNGVFWGGWFLNVYRAYTFRILNSSKVVCATVLGWKIIKNCGGLLVSNTSRGGTGDGKSGALGTDGSDTVIKFQEIVDCGDILGPLKSEVQSFTNGLVERDNTKVISVEINN